MSWQAETWGLLARTRDLRSMSEGFRSVGYSDKAWETMLVAGVIVGICVILFLISRYYRRFERLKSYDSRPELFRELCRLHKLDWSSRRLLKRLAAEWEMTSPALLFVEPERFNVARLPMEWHEETDRLEQLRTKLFA
ncbi:MAG: hypothetical protein AB7G28_24305 [Pirellulales bacterium]